MAKLKAVPLRSDVPVEDTWDLAPLFRTDAAWERAYKKLERMIPEFAEFKGKLGRSAKVLRACFDFQVGFQKLAERMGVYAALKASEDVADGTYQGMLARFTYVATRADEASSFFAPEVQAIPKKRMAVFLESPVLAPYRFRLEKLLRYKPHILSEPEERVLAMQGEVAETADKIFGQLNDADLSFGVVRNEAGEPIELTHASFRVLLESPKRSVRKRAFDAMYAQYDAHAHTFAAALGSSVLQDAYQARVRNYPSALEAALFDDKAPVSVYDNLIAAVHEHLEVVYRYFEVRRKAMRLRDLHHYDTYVPIVSDLRWRTPYDQAVATVCAALEPLGAAYCRTLEKGLRGRWVDRYENKNKRSGAFSHGAYAGPPYILMNYKQDLIDHVFTLAHEAGHSMHTYHSVRHQPFQDYQYTIFVAEVASTFNEQLLNHYLLERARDKKTRAYLINRQIDEIRGTLIRQTMFAEFEQVVHAIAEQGEPLTLERFRAEYRALLDRYFGPHFAIDDALSLECFRIPHFYSAFYVYKYATGISAAVTLARKVLEGGLKARAAYFAFLKSGGSNWPLDLLRAAGVDMETPEPVATTMVYFTDLIDELEGLL